MAAKNKIIVMKKLHLCVLFVLGFLCAMQPASAQTYTETESNNTFSTANLLNNFDTLNATVGGPDAIDYFRLDLNYWTAFNYTSGSVFVEVVATNTGTQNAVLNAQLFNGLQAAGSVYSGNIEGSVAPGATVTGSVRLCAQFMDDFYVAFSTDGSFSYKLRFHFSDPNPNWEPNNTRQTASIYRYDSINPLRQSVKYAYRGNTETDTVDYVKTIFPSGNFGNLGIYLSAKNNSCQGSKTIRYALYKNEEADPFTTGYIGTEYIPDFSEAGSIVPVGNMETGDSLTIKIWADAAFGYELEYRTIPSDFEEEYNDYDPEGYNQVSLAEGEVKTAQVGYHVMENGELQYDGDGNPIVDNYDTYRITLPQDGAITLYSSAKNDGCAYELLFDLQNQNGNTFSNWDYRTLVSFNGNCDITVQGSYKIRALMAGTYLIRIYKGNNGTPEKVSYTLKYLFQPYTSGSADQEFNNTPATAIAIAADETKKGYLNFISDNNDPIDYYKTTLAAEANLRVFLKLRYRGAAEAATNYNRFSFGCPTTNFTRLTPSGSVTQLTSDGYYLDTFTVSAVPAGEAMFRVYSDNAYEYEFRYEIIGSQNWPNDIEPNNDYSTAQVIDSNTTSGRVGYALNGVGDKDDFFRTVLPADGKLKIYIEAINKEEAQEPGWDWLNFSAYDGRKNGTLYQRHITGNDNIQIGQVVYDTVTICGVAKDTVYFHFEGWRKFQYRFRFESLDHTINNAEPNNYAGQAAKIMGGHTQKGTVGYTYRGSNDNTDQYKIVFGSNDRLKLKFKAINRGCTATGLRIRGFDKHQATLFNRFMGANGSIAIGEWVEDSIDISITAIDTVYLSIESFTPFEYEFTTGPLVPASLYSIVGDTSVCFGPQTYKAVNITDDNITYHWSLPSGGGTISYTDSIATVNWNQTSTRIVQLVLSNNAGSSTARQLKVIVNDGVPTQVPVAYNFARTLSTNSLPPGTGVQWYRNGGIINGATETSYYAAQGGSYTVRFVNDCGAGPASNAISFAADAQAQTISFPHTAPFKMSPGARLKLNAVASSGLPVLYQLISGAGRIVNDTLYVNVRDNFVIRATQPGDDQYTAAVPVYDTITVLKGDVVISLDSIPDKIYSEGGYFEMAAHSSAGAAVYTSIASGPGIADGKWFYYKGAGTVTVRAYFDGDYNYNAATPVERSFCIGVRNINPIAGDPNPCLATYTYTTSHIPGANFVWSLSGGGVLTTRNDTAFVQWQTPGTHTLKVKVNSNCDAQYSEEREYVITTSNNSPAPVSGMLPANGAIDRQLPLTLSWIPGTNTVSYDLYIWEATSAQPSTPYKSNLGSVSYVLPNNSFAYNTTYKWRIVSKNPCSQTDGPVQEFRLIPLADLTVSEVQAPLTANSGQTITISWKVTNVGPGRTLTDQKWTDGVFFSFDTIPDFRSNPDWNASDWSSLSTPVRPLLAATKPNVSALESGQHYTNTASFTLPVNYSQPLYIYVITNYPNSSNAPLQVTVANDTARAPQQMNIMLTPTPDLRVDTVFAPSTIFSGSTIDLTYKVKNYGTLTPIEASWTDSVFISESPLFNRNSATPLKLVKPDDSYYPGARDAGISISQQLQPDSSYTRTLKAVVPNFKFGTWFIHVQANADKRLHEGPLVNNNVNQAQVQIYLTPTPKLTVNSINVPVTTASTTQPFGINWVIRNEGFRDNVERNKGHIITMGSCHVGCSWNAPPGSVCYAPSVKTDSIVFGSSYWVDRVYLSTDPNGLNVNNSILLREIPHGKQFSGIYPPIVYCPANVSGNVNVDNVIHPGAAYPASATFNLPADLQQGTYYVYVFTNPTKTVFEYPGTPQIRRSADPVVVQRPDLTVPSVAVPSTAAGGQPVTIQYTVQNSGPGSVFRHIRRDNIYTSIWPVFDANAELVATRTYEEDILAGASVSHTYEYRFPAAATGNRYFYVVANYDSAFRENSMVNNVSAASMVSVSAAVPADLVVTSIQPADSFFTVFPSKLQYTIANNGAGATAGAWTDSVFISCSPVYNPATARFIAARTHSGTIGAGEAYTDTLTLLLPYSYEISNCFAETMYGQAYFFVKTNADNATYEAGNVNNNIAASGSSLIVNPLVDHVVTRVDGGDGATVGRSYQASWIVKNIGYNPNQGYLYNSWADEVYFSPDPVLNQNAVPAQLFVTGNVLQRGDSIRLTKTFMVPDLPAGDYYVLVHTNARRGIAGEKEYGNNVNIIRDASGTPKKIHVVRPPLPDLTDSIMVAPVSVAIGQPLSVIHRVTNKGAGVTFPSSWKGELYLSTNLTNTSASGDLLLQTKNYSRVLDPGEYVTDTVGGVVPMNTVPGNYVLISKPNSGRSILENDFTNNNARSLVTIYSPDPVDLTVPQVSHPDTVYLGYALDTVKWIVSNNSTNAGKGVSKDGVYLSSGTQLDSTAVLLGILNKYIDMDPLDTDTFGLAPLVTGLVEGNYNLMVRTDMQNNILESDKGNNTGYSSTPVYVKVKELMLGITEQNTLSDTARYYKLLVPDSLLGSTIRVLLRTNDSLTMRNEIYIGAGYVPSPSRFDYKFENPNYGNQQIVMAEVSQPVYYITIRRANASQVVQNVTVRAEKLPFAILNVQSSSGGNSGNVTVKISGSLFSQGMTASLKNGSATITASNVYYTNSTQVYATFGLQGKPLGVYDVILTKTDGSQAIKEKGFSIVPPNNGGLITGSGPNTGPGNGNEPGCDPGAASGLNAQLVVEMVVPPRALLGRPITILINFSNPTNNDIPLQSRTLFAEEGLKLAFTREGVPNGSSSLYIEFTEPGGPPGIIRAGGSGTIVIYTMAPVIMPLDPDVLFKLR